MYKDPAPFDLSNSEPEYPDDRPDDDIYNLTEELSSTDDSWEE